MGIARSTYYDVPAACGSDVELLNAITAICDEFEAYGWRRVQAALCHQGVIANHKRIKRLMRDHDLQPRRRRHVISPPPTATMISPSSRIVRRISSLMARTSSGART